MRPGKVQTAIGDKETAFTGLVSQNVFVRYKSSEQYP